MLFKYHIQPNYMTAEGGLKGSLRPPQPIPSTVMHFGLSAAQLILIYKYILNTNG